MAVAIIGTSAVSACSQASGPGAPINYAPTRYPRTHYRLIWHDEFNGPAGTAPNPRLWVPATGKLLAHNGELEVYTDRRANNALDGRGYLAITARQHGRSYTSAKIETLGKFNVQYGRIEARIKIPRGTGLWPAFWLLGSDYRRVGWPESGELDAMEVPGRKPHLLVGTVHGPLVDRDSQWQRNVYAQTPRPLAAGFHVYGIDWSRGQIVFTLDGAPYGEVTRASLRSTDKWVFDRPAFVVLNLAVGGHFPGHPTAQTHFPATMLVDWVRVWKTT